MNKPSTYRQIIDLYPEEAREAADILKRAVPLMMRYALPANPVYYALWYTYCKGRDEELKRRRLDKAIVDFGVVPPNSRRKCFASSSLMASWPSARAGQQVIELVDDIEGGIP